MSLIQLLLAGGLLISLIVYFRAFRSQLLDRLVALALFVLAAIAIIFPDITSLAARALGVGRGTDLVVYIFFISMVFCIVLLYSKIARLQGQLTCIAREMAIGSARKAKR